MPDGLFVPGMAEEADCHILLNLHNILANQKNGRQSVKEFLEYIPSERFTINLSPCRIDQLSWQKDLEIY